MKSTEYNSPTPGADYLRKVNWDHKYRHENMSVDMDVWYPILESITFKTYFIHIYRKEAESILNFYDYKNKNKDCFTKEDTKILKNLENRIDYYFNKYNELKNGAMFRLTGRSGKDMNYYDNEKIYKIYLQNLENNCKKYNKDKNDINMKYISALEITDRFKVNNGKDVLNILLTSFRLHTDLIDWLKHGGKEQIVLRKWDDKMSPDKEFRCFVRNNEIKAICQDDRFALFPDLIKNKLIFEKLINEFFNSKVKPLMKIPNYIIDICVLDNENIKVIEFSPFLLCTSARLFRWNINHEEMLNGTGKLTVREKQFENLEMYVKDWEKLISKKSDHFDDYYIEDNKINSFFSKLNPINIYNNIINKYPNKNIFVVSVLKTGFYWSKKYITYDDSNNKNKYIGKTILENHCISVDKNGFGWIIPKEGKNCIGEVIEISQEDYFDIEFFYDQLDSKMQEKKVKINGKEIKVYVYIIKELFKNVKREENMEIEEYNIDLQNKEFNPMQHIINQQERYLNMSLDFDLKDSW